MRNLLDVGDKSAIHSLTVIGLSILAGAEPIAVSLHEGGLLSYDHLALAQSYIAWAGGILAAIGGRNVAGRIAKGLSNAAP